MEIERKYLVKELPENLEKYPHFVIEQGYLCTKPTIRIRRKNSDYILTYKSRQTSSQAADTCVNIEEEFLLSKEAYDHLKEKIDGILVRKTRYCIPYEKYTIELDLFDTPYELLKLAEVEFPSTEEASEFCPPSWFGKNVSADYQYSNSYLATKK